jgi:hypothetical protein
MVTNVIVVAMISLMGWNNGNNNYYGASNDQQWW